MTYAAFNHCFGRHDHLAQLREFYQQTNLHKRGKLVTITGERGIGKTTLLAQLEDYLREEGTLILKAECRREASSLGVIHQWIDQVLAYLSQAPSLYPLFERSEILANHLRLPDPQAVNLFEHLDEFISILQDLSLIRPLLISLHDFDLASPSTHRAIVYFARSMLSHPELQHEPFCGLLVLSLDKLHSSDDRTWLKEIDHHELKLKGIDSEAIRQVLSQDQIIDRIIELTAGNPHKIAKLFEPRYLVKDRNVLTGLSTQEYTILSILAVFGQPLTPDRLYKLTDLDTNDFQTALTQLVAQSILQKSIIHGNIKVSYRQLGDENDVYQSLTPAKRESLHAHIGRSIGNTIEWIETKAKHLLKGKCGSDAIVYAKQAAEKLELSFCYDEAIQLYQQALELSSDPKEQMTLLEAIILLCEQINAFESALNALAKLKELTKDPSSVLLKEAKIYLKHGDYHLAVDRLEKWHSLYEKDSSDTQKNESYREFLALRAETALLQGELMHADSLTKDALENLDETDFLLRFTLDNIRGKIALARKDNELAQRIFETNRFRSEQSGIKTEILRAEVQLGLTALNQKRYSDAYQHYQRSEELARSLKDYRALAIALQHLAVLSERSRNYNRAIALYQEAITCLKKIGHNSYLSWVSLDLAKLYIDIGEIKRAKAMVELAENLSEKQAPQISRYNSLLLKGRLDVIHCDYVKAERHLQAALKEASSHNDQSQIIRVKIELSKLSKQKGHHDKALKILESIDIQSHDTQANAEILVNRALLTPLNKRQTILLQALEFATKQKDPEFIWRAHFLLAEVALKKNNPQRANEHFEHACLVEARIAESIPEEMLDRYRKDPFRVLFYTENEKQNDALVVRSKDKAEANSIISSKMIGAHPSVLQLHQHIERVAKTDAIVLIRGESGTGKELIADAVHQHSLRKNSPFIKVNCGALVESLLLSELFGHEKGAFTGATERKIGRFERANGGTIFLDEIGDISPKTQVALLRVLQEQCFERVGGTKSINVDVRILFATHQNLEQMVEEGKFREDLYYRIRGIQLLSPPLRERHEDIPKIASFILQKIAAERGCAPKGIDSSAQELLCGYQWPGNVRELENVLRSVSLFADDRLLGKNDFSDYHELFATRIQHQNASVLNPYQALKERGLSLRDLKKELEAECISNALDEANGNITKAADLLGMKRPRLSQLIKEYQLSNSK